MVKEKEYVYRCKRCDEAFPTNELAKEHLKNCKGKSKIEVFLNETNIFLVIGSIFFLFLLIFFLFIGFSRGIFDVAILLISSLFISFGLRRNYKEFCGSFALMGLVYGYTIYNQGGYPIVWVFIVSLLSFLITLFDRRKVKSK